MSDLQVVLNDIHTRVQQRRDLEESEVTDVFTDKEFFQTLGYEGIPIDVRSENYIVGGDRPNYFAKDDIRYFPTDQRRTSVLPRFSH